MFNIQKYCLICCVLFLFCLHVEQVLCQMTLVQSFTEQNISGDIMFGCSVSGAGDVNKDGYEDVIVGAYRYNSFTGRAYVYHGGSGMDNTADVTMTRAGTDNAFGWSVSCAGDVNNDGYDDVIIGAYEYNSYTGRAYVYHGGSSMDHTTDVTMTGEDTWNQFGYSVSGAGDVNNDGYDDVIVGAWWYNSFTGRAYVYYGGSSMDNTVDVTMDGEGTDNVFGFSVSSAGDVNNDGYNEVIIGAYEYGDKDNGKAYVFSTSPTNIDIDINFEAPFNDFRLDNNYQNPFNPETNIEFEVNKITHIKLEIYNIMGQRIRTLLNRLYLPGLYNVVWDARNDQGNVVSTGTYFFIMKSDGYMEKKKAVFIK